ncbi:MAG TPA: phosphoribosylanthranilate isomerase, partial [Polyangiales bacterium]|nr:phosphoribosylanthranilate isomerase [Polyangiales bacterium]
GITSLADAELVLAAGADAIGLNFVPSSKRYVDPQTARGIVQRVGTRIECVGVIADLGAEEAEALRSSVGFQWLQLHGREPPGRAAEQARTFQAVAIGNAADAERAALYAGERLLVDAKSDGALGGTGKVFDWELVRRLCGARKVILAGGLTPENVTTAVNSVAPWGVDVASGVEVSGEPRRKDALKVERFVQAARHARE